VKAVALTEELRGAWDQFVANHPGAWWWHTTAWLDYCLAYTPGAVSDSFAVMDGETMLAIAPLVREGDQYVMGGEPGADVCARSTSPQQSLDALHLAHAELDRLAEMHGVKRAAMRSAVPWITKPTAPKLGWTDISWRTRVVDLERDEAALWSDVRKSYRGLIRQGERTYRLTVGDKSNGQYFLFDAYQAIHRRAHGHGYSPRSDLTFAYQREWLKYDGHALVVCAESSPTTSEYTSGAALFLVYKQAAYYASGAYVAENVSFPLLWHAMLTLKARGVRWLDMGWQGHAETDKGRNVEFFRAGFGGEDVPLLAIERNYP
jgi:hypothetical protein